MDVLNQILEKDPTHMGALGKWGLGLYETTEAAAFQSSASDPFASSFGSSDPFASSDHFLRRVHRASTNPEPLMASPEQKGVESSLLMRPEMRQVYKFMLVGFR